MENGRKHNMGMNYTDRERNIDKYSRYFKGSNFMTPHLIEYGEISNELVYELSHNGDSRFLGHKVYGVTVHKKTGENSGEDVGLSQCFFSMEEVNEYVNKLKGEYGQRAA
jgi:hypothetical protein